MTLFKTMGAFSAVDVLVGTDMRGVADWVWHDFHSKMSLHKKLSSKIAWLEKQWKSPADAEGLREKHAELHRLEESMVYSTLLYHLWTTLAKDQYVPPAGSDYDEDEDEPEDEESGLAVAPHSGCCGDNSHGCGGDCSCKEEDPEEVHTNWGEKQAALTDKLVNLHAAVQEKEEQLKGSPRGMTWGSDDTTIFEELSQLRNAVSITEAKLTKLIKDSYKYRAPKKPERRQDESVRSVQVEIDQIRSRISAQEVVVENATVKLGLLRKVCRSWESRMEELQDDLLQPVAVGDWDALEESVAERERDA